jgi:hypothetical protein
MKGMGERYKRVDARARLIFTDAIWIVLDFVRGKTFSKCDEALPSCILLIPLSVFPEPFRRETRARFPSPAPLNVITYQSKHYEVYPVLKTSYC